MIQSFKGKWVEALHNLEGPGKGFPGDLVRVAQRKLAMLDAAVRLENLSVPPGNRLEALAGNRAGQHSIRINDQWRICFRWTEAGPEEVEIVDYH
jgi:proteic killer suppression protein